MEPKIEITIDRNGDPIIKFRHNQLSDHVQQKLIDVFTARAKKEGLYLANPSGCAGSESNGTRIRHENYEIKLGPNPTEKKNSFRKLLSWK